MAPFAAIRAVSFATLASATLYKTQTPPMGWNSYNYYGCYPSETIMKTNAQGLVDTGLADAGYTYVTTDCGWPATERDADGRVQWNADLFPSGPVALGEFIHGLGLKFGLYSGAGYYQCGSTDQPASLGYETIDAQSYAEWGGDSLKYDNCYASSPDVMVDNTSPTAISPDRFDTMANALEAVDRDFMYAICQWGLGSDVGTWASAIGTSWRVSNDIYAAWRSIWRITNEVVPYYKHTTVGAYPDMDMLEVGHGELTEEEERFHFGMWAINKSPLTIGMPLDGSAISQTSLDILANAEVIALNQDSLGKQAELVRRYTEEEWDIWAGDLSSSRKVVGVANWKNEEQTVTFDLAAVNVSSATARDIWSATDLGTLSGSQTFTLAGHELKLLILSDITDATAPSSVGYHDATSAQLGGSAVTAACDASECAPVGAKVGSVGGTGSGTVTFSAVQATTAGTKLVGVDFINYDVAIDTAWDWGSNTRNMTIAVNDGTAKRWAFPISGGDWYETGRLYVEVDGFAAGDNTVILAGTDTAWAPDVVGIEVYE